MNLGWLIEILNANFKSFDEKNKAQLTTQDIKIYS